MVTWRSPFSGKLLHSYRAGQHSIDSVKSADRMSLRELATASDVCTPADDGAGPSNALSSFTNTLLGRSSKTQERLRELPGVRGLPTPAPWAQAGPSSLQAVARAAAEGELMGIPGVSQGAPGDVEEFLAQARAGHPGPLPREYADFEQIYQGVQPGRPMGQGLPAGPMAGLPGLTPSLHAFLASAKIQGAFQPPPTPPLQLTQLEQCRIRDRSTIMARHLFADRGDAFADEQVGNLLHSLRIDPRQLPGQPELAAFDAIYKAGALHHAHPSAAAEHAANAQHLAQLQGPANGWVDDFSRLQLGGQPHEQWAQDFAAQQQNRRAQSWNQIWDESNGHTNQWATEFDQSQSATAAVQAGGRVENSAKALKQTQALADTLASDKDGKFANSKFLQFVSKMSRGEILLEGNEAKEISAESAAWAKEFEQAAEHSRAQGYEHIWKHYGELQEDATGWADEFGGISQAAEQWADQFAEQIMPNEEVRSWLDDWESEATQAREAMAAAAADDYKFAENNPFLNDMNSLAKGKSLFQSGLLSEAVLALEAEVQRQPQNVEAWRLLGTVHAENDDDQQAIAALNRAMATDPNNAEVLLSLGVSYTNELDQGRALNFLTAWLSRQPAFTKMLQDAGPPQDSSQRLTHALATFEQAAAQEAGNADVQVALGVLRSLARQYSAAGDAFRAALAIRPRDYSLWNKLGATLANSSSSQEAIAAYQKALDLKPNYMRAWTNMGIAQANVGNYETSARFYIRALSMNPKAASTWGYLRTSLACSGRMDLMELVHESNLDALQKELPL